MTEIRSYLLDNLPQLDTVVRKSREDEEIQEIDKFGVSIEFGTSMNYKDRVKRKETLFFLNCFCLIGKLLHCYIVLLLYCYALLPFGKGA